MTNFAEIPNVGHGARPDPRFPFRMEKPPALACVTVWKWGKLMKKIVSADKSEQNFMMHLCRILICSTDVLWLLSRTWNQKQQQWISFLTENNVITVESGCSKGNEWVRAPLCKSSHCGVLLKPPWGSALSNVLDPATNEINHVTPCCYTQLSCTSLHWLKLKQNHFYFSFIGYTLLYLLNGVDTTHI